MNNIEDIFPLSPMQEGMMFHSLLHPGSAEYIEQISCTLNGRLDTDFFIRAWDYLIQRHSVLRTAFIWEESREPLQIVIDSVPSPVEIINMPGKEDKIAAAEEIASIRQKDVSTGFLLSEAPLMKIKLILINETETMFIWTHHHILFDGWGMQILLKELFTIYYSFCSGNFSPELPAVRPFRDYIEWIREQDDSEAENFWRDRLHSYVPAKLLLNRNETQSDTDQKFISASEMDKLPEPVTHGLIELARNTRTTLSAILQAAWGAVLSRYSNQNSVSFGLTLSVRPAELSGSESTIGLFINTIPVILQLDSDLPFHTWLQHIHSAQAEAIKYAHYPLYKIQKLCSHSHEGLLFESIVVVENFPISEIENESSNGLQLSDVDSFSKTNYPLTVVFSPGESLGIEISYDSLVYTSGDIKKLIKGLKHILSTVCESPYSRLSDLDVMSPAEKDIVLNTFRYGQKVPVQFSIIHKWFETIALLHPDNTAVCFGDKQLSFNKLNILADRLADVILCSGCLREEIIGIYQPRTPELIVSILAILKAGCSFMIFDVKYPEDRIRHICSETGCRIVITRDNTLFENMLTISPEYSDEPAGYKRICKSPEIFPENLAYVIYTSGSTGKPKGTLLHHKGFCNFMISMISDFGITPDSRILQSSSAGFDSSVAEIFSALLTGASLILPDNEDIFSVEDIYRILKESRTTHLSLPPSILSLLGHEDLPEIQTIAAVGEACPWHVPGKWTAENRRFINGYGPTETTVGAAWFIHSGELSGHSTATVPLGRPLRNVTILLLDSSLKPVPTGVIGEIYIGGNGLARGYLKKPGLTAERFIPDPFSDNPGDRLYKTGDLGIWLEDGSLEFRGRADRQIKIRGYRVEPDEITAVIVSTGKAEDAAVFLNKYNDGIDRLTAYIIPKKDARESFDVSAFRQELRTKLPSYMIPSHFVLIDSFPRTATGKIDYSALPEASGHDETGLKTMSSDTPGKELLSNIWMEVLKLKNINDGENFFELGGHSLLATQLAARIRDVFRIDLPILSIFKYPTISKLDTEINRLIQERNGSDLPELKPGLSSAGVLSFAQKRLWFLDQLSEVKTSYNIPSAFRIKGPFSTFAFELALKVITKRHEVLRTRFGDSNGIPRCIIDNENKIDLSIIDMSGLNDQQRTLDVEIEKFSSKPFDLTIAPLLRASVFLLSENETVVLFVMHHIISDGWSLGILIREISAAYAAAIASENIPDLPELNVSYSDYAAWQQLYFNSSAYEKSLNYWKERLNGIPSVLDLPFDRPRPAVAAFNGSSIDVQIPAQLLSGLQNLSRENNTTLFMTMLAAFQILLFRYTGQQKIAIGSPIAGRTHTGLADLIGFFVNNLVLTSDISPNLKFSEHLQNVRNSTLEAYAHQHMPFEKLVEELHPVRDLSHSPLFQVMFVFQNLPENGHGSFPLELEPYRINSSQSNFELSIVISEMTEGLNIEAEYNTDLFNSDTIQKMLEHYILILNEITGDPEQKIGYIPILTKEEERTLLDEWNNTSCDFDSDITVHRLFEKIAARQPAAPALIYMKDDYSPLVEYNYQDLNAHANSIAYCLTGAGLGPERNTGVCLGKSFGMIAGIIGILKTGAAFVPIDPRFPRERIEYIAADSHLEFLITQRSLEDKFAGLPVNLIFLDELLPALIPVKNNLCFVHASPDNLAYIIYTSGTTGKPKGTMLSHSGLINLSSEQRKHLGIEASSRILQFSSLSFDASVWEIVMALLNGASLCLASGDIQLSGENLGRVIDKMGITAVTLPPSVLATMPAGEYKSLRTLVTAGEAVSPEIVRQWSKGRYFFNAYGPTETTVCASIFHCPDLTLKSPPIGKPLGNFRLYILDGNLEPVPCGVPGELCIGGTGLARGYLNQPGLTAEKFVPDRFSRKKGERLYRTGDLVKYLEDGNIEFLGRIDGQVKIRGFRIETGDIESALKRHESVKDAAVIAHKNNGMLCLTAYIVQDETKPAVTADIKTFLRGILPEFMVPAFIIKLEHMPLNSSGKIDRKALPCPDISRVERSEAFKEPENDTQQKLADILKELLRIDKISINDSFFDIGGHSLLATQYISRIRQVLGIELPLRCLFQYPSIKLLDEEIRRTGGSSINSLQPAIKKAERRKVKFSELEMKS